MGDQTKSVLFLAFADDSKVKPCQWRPFSTPNGKDERTLDEISNAINEVCTTIRKQHHYCPGFRYHSLGISGLKNDTEKHWEEVHGVIVDLKLSSAEANELREAMWTEWGEGAHEFFSLAPKSRLLACILPSGAPIPNDIQKQQSMKNSVFRFQDASSSDVLARHLGGWLADISTDAEEAFTTTNHELRKAVKDFLKKLR